MRSPSSSSRRDQRIPHHAVISGHESEPMKWLLRVLILCAGVAAVIAVAAARQRSPLVRSLMNSSKAGSRHIEQPTGDAAELRKEIQWTGWSDLLVDAFVFAFAIVDAFAYAYAFALAFALAFTFAGAIAFWFALALAGAYAFAFAIAGAFIMAKVLRDWLALRRPTGMGARARRRAGYPRRPARGH
jgi:hypothetical protein